MSAAIGMYGRGVVDRTAGNTEVFAVAPIDGNQTGRGAGRQAHVPLASGVV